MRTKIFPLTFAIAASLSAVSAIGAPSISYVPNSLIESSVYNGPWVLHQATKAQTYDASGIVPPASQKAPPYSGTGTPYVNLCNSSGQFVKNVGKSLMQPYYFPFVRMHNGVMEGFFDYRPRNETEVTVSAVSNDLGKTWHYVGQSLALNPYCPADITDPDNQNVLVNGITTSYASVAANAADNGLGHAFVMTVGGVQRIYHLNRATNHIDSDQLVVHALRGANATQAVAKLPAYGYVSPIALTGYPTLDSTAFSTTGLVTPDAILGTVKNPSDGSTMVVYVAKHLSADTAYPTAQQCGSTPSFALPNVLTGSARKANHDITEIRVATTTDGVNFVDAGAVATGLNDPKTVAYNGVRWLGSGSILPLADGRYGMFFGAGNCLDNDSDGFHFIGYAETVNVVQSPSDLLSWTIIQGFDNPILSTDTLTNGSVKYPANAPVIDVAGVDALAPYQVAPFTAPAGYATNFFSGRAYDPQAVATTSSLATVVFAGYNTPQPSLNLGDYRTIGRFQLRFPNGYLKVVK